jgi:putative NIF3 family GTP cyclohydrolase 1 type 2
MPAGRQAEIRSPGNCRGGISIAALRRKMRFLRRRSVPSPENGPLAEVVNAEKAAAATVAAARLEADAWVETERRATTKEKDATLQELAACASRDEAAARQAASADAAKVIEAAEQFSRNLHALSDRELQTILAKHMAAILPGPEP